MKIANTKQKFQDWFTQQWAIFWGKRIEPERVPWLMGPFGKPDAIAEDFINKIAEEEGLTIERNATSHGLISSIEALKLSAEATAHLSEKVKDFYENTGLYQLKYAVKWNPVFRIFGILVSYLFSKRIGQLHIPTNNIENAEQINSELITLSDPKSGKVKHVVWFRTLESTGQVLYAGIYNTCTLPSGATCIKAVFPLPHGNATVIMLPIVGPNGALYLDSSGKKFGDPGFYFLLRDAKGTFWSQHIKSFRDQLIVCAHQENVVDEQTLTLWHWRVLRFNYNIRKKNGEFI